MTLAVGIERNVGTGGQTRDSEDLVERKKAGKYDCSQGCCIEVPRLCHWHS